MNTGDDIAEAVRSSDHLTYQSRLTMKGAPTYSQFPAYKHIRVGLTEIPYGYSWYGPVGEVNGDVPPVGTHGYTLTEALNDAYAVNPSLVSSLVTGSTNTGASHLFNGVGLAILDSCSEYCKIGRSTMNAASLNPVTGKQTPKWLSSPGLYNRIRDNAKPLSINYTPSWLDPKLMNFIPTSVPYAPYTDEWNTLMANVYAGIPLSTSRNSNLSNIKSIGDIPMLWNGRSSRDSLSWMESTGTRALGLDMNLVNSIREMKDLPKTIIVLARLFTTFLRPKRLLGRSGQLVRFVSNQFLNYQYGIAPTISEVQTLLELLEGFQQGKTKIPVASSLYLDGFRTMTGSQFSPRGTSKEDPNPEFGIEFSDQRFSFQSEFRYRDSPGTSYYEKFDDIYALTGAMERSIVRVKAYVPVSAYTAYSANRGFFKTQTPVFQRLSALSQRVGISLNMTDFLYIVADTLWEAVPFSFLVDYFLNADDLIRAKFRDPEDPIFGLGEYSLYRFDGIEWMTSFYSSRSEPGKWGITNKTLDQHLCSMVLARVGVREYTRWRGIRFESPSVEWSIPTKQQWCNIAALLASNYRS